MSAYNTGGGQTTFANAIATFTLASAPGTTSPTYTSVGLSSITAQWTGNSNANGTLYTVEISTWSGFAGTVTTSATYTVNVTTIGLTSGATYHFRVKATNNNGLDTAFTGLGSTQTAVIVSTIPTPAPSNVAFFGVTVDSVSVQWNVNTGSQYLMVLSSVSDFSAALSSGIGSADVNTTSYMTLDSNGTYYFKVKVATAPDASYSSAISTITPARTPALVSYQVNYSSVSVTVNPSGNRAGTTLIVTTGSFAASASSQVASGAGNSNIVMSGLVPNTTYTIQEAANGFNGQTSSATLVITTPTLPVAPTVSLAVVSSETITYTVGLNGNSTGQYTLEFSTMSDYTGSGLLVSTRTLDNASTTYSGLTLGTTYYLRARVLWVGATVNPAHNATPFVAISTATQPIIYSTPSAPVTVSAANISTISVRWTWTDSASNEDGYRVISTTGGSISGNLAAQTVYFDRTSLRRFGLCAGVLTEKQLAVSFTLAAAPATCRSFRHQRSRIGMDCICRRQVPRGPFA